MSKKLGFHLHESTDPKPTMVELSLGGFVPSIVQVSISDGLLVNSFAMSRGTSVLPEVVIHAPYWLNLVRDDALSRRSIHWMKAMFRAFYRNRFSMDITGLVVHLGFRARTGGEMISMEEARNNVASFLDEISSHIPDGVTLYLENTAGSHNGNQYGSVEDIRDAVLGAPANIRACLDTCHCVAEGIPVLEAAGSLAGLIGLIHMNASPAEVSLGSHKDIHSYNKLRESVHSRPEDLKAVYNSFDCPFILERKSLPVVLDDARFLQE